MNKYFNQFIPQLGAHEIENTRDDFSPNAQDKPKLKYLVIYNPTLIDEKSEADEELIKQVLCFVNTESSGFPLNSNLNDVINIKLKILGIIGGIEAFSNNFAKDPKSGVSTIETSKSITIVKELEDNYSIACCIALPSQSKCRSELINFQVLKLIDQAYNLFVVLNTSFSKILFDYSMDVLKDILFEYWNDFLFNFNNGEFISTSNLKWPNKLNHKGFLGLLDIQNQRTTYKKSSILFDNNIRSLFDEILNQNTMSNLQPKGLVVSCFDKSVPKNYGMVYATSSVDDDIKEEIFLNESLAVIHNWLEYFDFHNKFNTENLTKPKNIGIFSTQEPVEGSTNLNVSTSANIPTPVDETDVRSIRSTAASTFEMFNPINLTNNLIILPISNTMNNVMNLGAFNNEAHLARSDLQGIPNRSWLSVPSYLKPFGPHSSHEQSSDQHQEIQNTQDEVIDDIDENTGNYVIGLTINQLSEYQIHKKLIYLKSKYRDHEGKTIEDEREYSLVIFRKDCLVFSLIYDSYLSVLDESLFYNTLSKSTLLPAIEEISNITISANAMGTSIDSLPRSLRLTAENRKNFVELRVDPNPDNDFYFVVYDSKEGWIKSSLPYLPLSNATRTKENKEIINLKYENAIFQLHDQLSDIFVVQKTKDFFHEGNMNEYFHKFNHSKHFDWMFYYMKHNNKFIIILKSHNRNHKANIKRRGDTSRKKSSIINSSPSTIASGNINDDNLLHQITDYAHLGFLNNLGDDVKLWLESFSITGDT